MIRRRIPPHLGAPAYRRPVNRATLVTCVRSLVRGEFGWRLGWVDGEGHRQSYWTVDEAEARAVQGHLREGATLHTALLRTISALPNRVGRVWGKN